MKDRISTLTPRQREVARLVSLGCTQAEIGAILDLSQSTVDNHVSAIRKRLGTDKSVLIARLAMKYGLSPLADKLTLAEKRRSGRKGDGWN
jgi:DNA-binding CsgD family transcriptional regulator